MRGGDDVAHDGAVDRPDVAVAHDVVVGVVEHEVGLDQALQDVVRVRLRRPERDGDRIRRPVDDLSPALASRETPFEVAANGERARQVQQALLKLTPDARAVIVMRHYGDLSYDEIAAALDVPSKTVKSRLYAARQRLGEMLLGWKAES